MISYDCPFIERAPRLTGLMSDSAWQSASPTWLGGLTGDPVPQTELDYFQLHANTNRTFPDQDLLPTALRLCWTETHLFIAFQCVDTDLWSTFALRDEPVYLEDSIGVLLQPPTAEGAVAEIALSPNNVVYDAKHIADAGPDRWWRCKGLQTMVRVAGTVGRRADRDRWWCAELAIPFASVPGGVTPTAGDVWKANFYRVDRGGRSQVAVWSPLAEGEEEVRNPERFGEICFRK